jgi:DNA-binding response OmpR family regulator
VKNGIHPGAVLIVEDAETCAATLEIIFSSIHGLKILTAESAERAWELLENRDEDIRVLVTYLHMPGMDGFE